MVGELLPLVFGDDGHQILLDFRRRLLLGDTQPTREALDVGVDDDTLDDVVAVLEDDVGGLPADAGQVGET